MDSSYAVCMLPIVAGHIMIPPLSYFAGLDELPEKIQSTFNLIYLLGPREFHSSRFVTSLALDYDPKDRSQGLTYQHFTHMFVHGTYEHLIANVASALLHGRAVFDQLGAAHLYVVYFMGGLMATTPSFLYDKVSGRMSLLGGELVRHFSGKLSVPENISAPVASAVAKAGELLSSIVPSLYIGSSGAEASLMGCGAVASICTAYSILDSIFYRKTLRKKALSYDLYFSVVSLYQSVRFILEETRLCDPSSLLVQSSSYWDKVVQIFRVSGVNHACHVQGFAFGVCYGLAVLVVPRVVGKCKEWYFSHPK